MTTQPEYRARRARLVAALRSGEFEQTTGVLEEIKEDGSSAYCCLGVACRLMVAEAPGLVKTHEGLHAVRDQEGEVKREVTVRFYNGYEGIMPLPVREWYGFQSGRGSYDDASLVGKNDSGSTFEEIADIIESEPRGLFY